MLGFCKLAWGAPGWYRLGMSLKKLQNRNLAVDCDVGKAIERACIHLSTVLDKRIPMKALIREIALGDKDCWEGLQRAMRKVLEEQRSG